jgi:N-acylneuraminate cytidylyltransferase
MRKIKDINIIAIIPARGGSKGIPKKNIIDFCGRPLISWTIEEAQRCKYIKDIYVSSDDNEILKIAKEEGAKIIKRPIKLATDTSSAEEALQHAIVYIERVEKKDIELVVFLQVTSPLRTSQDIDKSIEMFLSKEVDSLFSATEMQDFCIWQKKARRLVSLTYDYKNRGRRQDRPPLYLENGSIYIFKPNILKEYNNRLGGKIAMYLMDYWKSYEIDKVPDLEVCKYFMKNRILNKVFRVGKSHISNKMSASA